MARVLDIARRVHDHTWKLDPIIRSIIDTDFYKLLMLQMIWKMHRDVDATFSLINRKPAIRLADAIGVYPHELYLPREQSGIRAKNPPSAQEETPHAKARPKSGTKARAKKAPSKTSGARARAKKQPRAKGRDA